MGALEEYRQVRSLSTDEVRVLERDDWWIERHVADAAIAELGAALADESARVEEFRSTLAETRKQRDAILARAEQAEVATAKTVIAAGYQMEKENLQRAERAEAHAADCKRLVTSCEDDIDALRLLNREYRQDRDKAEAEVARLRKLFGMAERGTK